MLQCIATLRSTHGVHGEVVCVPAHGLPFVLSKGMRVYLLPPQLDLDRYTTVTSVRPFKESYLVQFDSLQTVELAEKFVANPYAGVFIPEEELKQIKADLGLADEESLLADQQIEELLDAPVFYQLTAGGVAVGAGAGTGAKAGAGARADGDLDLDATTVAGNYQALGTLEDVELGEFQDLLVIATQEYGSVLIPLVEEFVDEISPEGVYLTIPESLLGLNCSAADEADEVDKAYEVADGDAHA